MVLACEVIKLCTSIILIQIGRLAKAKSYTPDIAVPDVATLRKPQGNVAPTGVYRKNLFIFVSFAVPGNLYAINNALHYRVLRKMNLGTFALLSSSKVPVTALLMRIFLGKTFSKMQVVALVTLSIGSLASLLSFESNVFVGSHVDEYLLTFLSVMLSAFASVYTEFVLKSVDQSVHVQNSQLYFHGAFACAIGLIFSGQYTLKLPYTSDAISWLAILTLACVGILTSLVMKYADNLIRLFISACSLSVSQFLGAHLFNEEFSSQRFLGLCLILISLVLYDPPFRLLDPLRDTMRKARNLSFLLFCGG
jgi:UDP-galactose transporter